MKNLVLKDKMGQIIRFFRWETEKAYLVYRKKKGRLDLCSSPNFFEEEKDSIILIDELDINKMQAARPVPLIQGGLEIYDEILFVRHSLPRPDFTARNLWKIFGCVLIAYIIVIGVLYGLSQFGTNEEKKTPRQHIVKIIQPPAVIQPETVVIGSRQMFIRNSKTLVKKRTLKKSLKKMGALSALGNLSKKDSRQKSGLNLGASQVSAGPGFRAIASNSGSGGIQDSLYSKGMITAALGSGGNIRGGGGHGTKGTERGGGSAGYGELSLIGSGGTEALSSSSVLSSQGGHFDFSIIDKEIVKHIGKIRQCYDTALKTKPDLTGLLKIYFTINPKGAVLFSKVHSSSQVRSQNISSCILGLINQIQFPIQLSASVGVNYDFDLRALETEGR